MLVAALLKRPMTPPNSNPTMDYHTADSEHVTKRPRPMGVSEEVATPHPTSPAPPKFLHFFSTHEMFLLYLPLQVGLPTAHLPVGYSGIARSQHSFDELPRTVATTLAQGSSVTSMDFHPVQLTILLG